MLHEAAVVDCTRTCDVLPDDVWLEIFSYLSPKELSVSVLPVCHRWNNLGHHSSLWKKIEFGTYVAEKLNMYIDLVKRHHNIQSIECFDCQKEFIEHVVTLCPNLIHLSLPHATVTKYTMKALVKCCPRIMSLDLSANEVIRSRDTFLPIFSLHQLQTLKLNSCKWVTSSFVSRLVTSCKGLQCLHLECVFLPCETVAYVLHCLSTSLRELSVKCEKLDWEVKELLHECRQLQSLKIEVLLGPINIHFSHACDHLKNLKELTLNSCSERMLEVPSRVFLGSTFPSVTHLFIRQASGNDALADDIISSFPSLETLTLVDCCTLTDMGVTKILRCCHKLIDLRIYLCQLISKNCFTQPLNTGQGRSHLVRVQHLYPKCPRVDSSYELGSIQSDFHDVHVTR
ncbi:F-box/LRR-repeat protein fbxl-1-like [Hyalella azteca]|uniref:F-box/LRR-repeat protein fbxl-1-like n=1 Tax=Hyalella azteca TaxID=294128 RepID=A0A979FRN4_HYAAZ|nr:F-box/LRR-repeat protein fbxl-1-like [Hyalella azteca]